jgi:hypothetical protein
MNDLFVICLHKQAGELSLVITHFTADTFLLHSLVSLFVSLLAILTEALHSILLLATKRV